MRMRVRLPKVEPDQYDWPTVCPHAGCGGQRFKAHGVKGERKPLRDSRYEMVRAYRRKCLRCGGTHRTYPRGVSADQQSDRLKGLSVLLYVLGLSYGGIEDLLSALGMCVGKTTVYENVQEAGVASRRLQREELSKGGPREVIGSDGTYLKVQGTLVNVQVVVDDRNSDLLSLDIVVSENAEEVEAVVRGVAEVVGAEVLVSDGLDSYRQVADNLGLAHQICRNHMKRNVDALAEALREQLQSGEPRPEGTDLSPERLCQDLDTLCELVRARPADGEERLAQMYDRYKGVPPPAVGERHTVWYRMRMLITRLWERWWRLTLDQRRKGMDGTNNSAERMIGWWCKERYRTMRGYKRIASIHNVVTLTARMGVRSGSYDMAELYA